MRSSDFFIQHCVTEKYQWVDKYLGKKAVTQLMLTKDKTIVHGDILIDDKPLIKGLDEPRKGSTVFFKF